MAKRALFILNPYSGRGTIKNHLYEVVEVLSAVGYEVTVYPTKGPGDGGDMVAERGGRFKLLVVSGGDGTLSECVGGVIALPEGRRPVIGYIPTGSTNDFATSLKLPKKVDAAMQVITEGSVLKCDVGVFNDSCFVYIAAFGAFTDVAYGTPQEVKNYLGHMAYILEGIKRLPNIRSQKMVIKHDGEEIHGDFIYGMISNSTYVGGLKSYNNYEVSFRDGVFECVFIKVPENPIELQTIISGLLMRDFSGENFCTFKASKLEIKSKENVSWTLDGEYGGDHSHVTINNLKEAIKIIVDEKKKI